MSALPFHEKAGSVSTRFCGWDKFILLPDLNVQPLQRYRGMLVKVFDEHDVFVYVSKL